MSQQMMDISKTMSQILYNYDLAAWNNGTCFNSNWDGHTGDTMCTSWVTVHSSSHKESRGELVIVWDCMQNCCNLFVFQYKLQECCMDPWKYLCPFITSTVKSMLRYADTHLMLVKTALMNLFTYAFRAVLYQAHELSLNGR